MILHYFISMLNLAFIIGIRRLFVLRRHHRAYGEEQDARDQTDEHHRRYFQHGENGIRGDDRGDPEAVRRYPPPVDQVPDARSAEGDEKDDVDPAHDHAAPVQIVDHGIVGADLFVYGDLFFDQLHFPSQQAEIGKIGLPDQDPAGAYIIHILVNRQSFPHALRLIVGLFRLRRSRFRSLAVPLDIIQSHSRHGGDDEDDENTDDPFPWSGLSAPLPKPLLQQENDHDDRCRDRGKQRGPGKGHHDHGCAGARCRCRKDQGRPSPAVPKDQVFAGKDHSRSYNAVVVRAGGGSRDPTLNKQEIPRSCQIEGKKEIGRPDQGECAGDHVKQDPPVLSVCPHQIQGGAYKGNIEG